MAKGRGMGSSKNLIQFVALFQACMSMLVSSVGRYDSATYIVQVHESAKPSEFTTHGGWYSSMLASVKGLDVEAHAPLHTYHTVFHGFSAQLAHREAEALQNLDGVLSVIPDVVLQLHTTRSPEFLGLTSLRGLWPVSGYGEDVIIGIVDTGVWPESRSFRDDLLGPVPGRWKGSCEVGTSFGPDDCNRKLIGARSFFTGYETQIGQLNETIEMRSARDTDGHGTHTSSTAAGSPVDGASLFGAAGGVARGMAPRARIAVYKACWAKGCVSSDVVAAFDRAVADGVDIISASIGGDVKLPYTLDAIAIGAFGAMEKGVLISMSAGNSGPSPGSVINVAPWMLTVAASTMDRSFPASLKLGNNASFMGTSLFHHTSIDVPLVYFGNSVTSALCKHGSLPSSVVGGKVVLCDRGSNARAAKGMAVMSAGGVGMILANAESNGDELVVDSHVLPTIAVGFKDGKAIKAYIEEQSSHPTAQMVFSGATQLGTKPAPRVAAFSARGPNLLNPEIVKPDLSAPGVNILAAWPRQVSPTQLQDDTRTVDFNILSGTSMSCPHASGLAALLKGVHPTWSPAAIKSALMTTSTTLDNTCHTIGDSFNTTNTCTSFCYGSGHVNPSKAISPGLVYDLGIQDYVDFLCSMNYTSNMLMPFTKGHYNCSQPIMGVSNLNYPSLSVVFSQHGTTTTQFHATYTRTLTNVGPFDSMYTLTLNAPPGVDVKVQPTRLFFTRKYQKRSYTITLKATPQNLHPSQKTASFGFLLWSYEAYKVYSPLVFTWHHT